MTTLSDDLKRLAALKRAEAVRKKAYDQAKEERVLWERHCYDRFDTEDGWTEGKPESSRTLGDVSYVPQQTPYAQVQDKRLLVEYARENDEGLIEQGLRKKLLNQLVREKLDNGEPLPPGLGFYTKEFISVRGANQQEDPDADDDTDDTDDDTE